MKQLLRFQILVVILLFAQDVRAQNSVPAVPDTVKKDTCRCSCESAYYPGGNALFADSLVRITSRQVKPSSSGTIYIRFTITESGALVNPQIMRSVDPKFEAVLLKNMPRMGTWIPMCTYPAEPGFDDCCTRKPVSVTMQMPIKITAK